MHLFDGSMPFAGNAPLRHGDATVADYRRLQQRLGLSRCVIVQPSGYGSDHRVLVAGLRALGPAARGIAVVTPDVHPDDLAMLAAHGVVGTRMNLVQRGTTDESMLEALADRIAPLGWHLQVHLESPRLLQLADRLRGIAVPIVIDHYARVGTVPEVAEQVRRTVLELLGTGRAWLKLSGPYIASSSPQTFDDLDRFVSDVVAHRPDRLLWGSDWPHVTESVKPDDALLLDRLGAWVPDPTVRERILVHNPTTLYQR